MTPTDTTERAHTVDDMEHNGRDRNTGIEHHTRISVDGTGTEITDHQHHWTVNPASPITPRAAYLLEHGLHICADEASASAAGIGPARYGHTVNTWLAHQERADLWQQRYIDAVQQLINQLRGGNTLTFTCTAQLHALHVAARHAIDHHDMLTNGWDDVDWHQLDMVDNRDHDMVANIAGILDHYDPKRIGTAANTLGADGTTLSANIHPDDWFNHNR